MNFQLQNHHMSLLIYQKLQLLNQRYLFRLILRKFLIRFVRIRQKRVLHRWLNCNYIFSLIQQLLLIYKNAKLNGRLLPLWSSCINSSNRCFILVGVFREMWNWTAWKPKKLPIMMTVINLSLLQIKWCLWSSGRLTGI